MKEPYLKDLKRDLIEHEGKPCYELMIPVLSNRFRIEAVRVDDELHHMKGYMTCMVNSEGDVKKGDILKLIEEMAGPQTRWLVTDVASGRIELESLGEPTNIWKSPSFLVR
jgi:hypothetical protein